MYDVDEGKAVLDFASDVTDINRDRCTAHATALSLSLSLSLSRMQTHTHTHTRRDHCCCSFFFHVLFRTYRVACLTFVWHFLFIVTRIGTLFFQARVCSPPLFHPLTKFFSNQRQSFFTSVKGLAKSKSRSTHARTRPRPPNCQSTCSPQQAGVRKYSSVELSFLYRGITSKKKNHETRNIVLLL